MRTAKITAKRALGLTLVAALAVGGTLAAQESAQAAVGRLTLSSPTGPAVTATFIISAKGTGFQNTAGVRQVKATNVGVQFSSSTCATTYAAADGTTTFASTALTVPSATQLVITTPSLALGASSAAKAYNICVYDTSDALMSTGSYKVYPRPAITSAIAPTSGSVAGGTRVVISGTGFSKVAKVYFGTTASPKVTFTSATSITAVAPGHAAGAVDIKVTTEGGTNATPGTITFDDFTYVNAIVVSPSTGTVAGADISISGVGFSDLDFTRTGSATVKGPSAVYLTKGAYDPTITGAVKTNPEVATCGSPVVVSDTQLVCTVPATGGAFLRGAYTVTVVDDNRIYDVSVVGANTATKVGTVPSQSVLSSGSTYTVADF